ncbi:MAG: hypothetical protein AB7V08_13940 [Elusimicrobiales bacterium]
MRISLALVRFLAYTNGLEAFTALAAFAWAIGLLLSGPAIATPIIFAALALVPAAITSLLAQACGWRRIRQLTSLVAFYAWGLTAWHILRTEPEGFALAGGLYIALSLGELTIYVRILVSLDDRAKQEALHSLTKTNVREICRTHHGQGTQNGSSARLH